MEHISKLVRARRSVRTFDGQGVGGAELEKLIMFAEKIENPYGIPVSFCLLDADKHRLNSPVIIGEKIYAAATVPRTEHAEEAFGYSFETFVLYAQSLGLGTTWIGGTMNRKAFETAVHLSEDGMMPCVTPVGRPAAKMSLRETVMRKGTKADSRKPFGELFFDGSFDAPLTAERAGNLAEPLECVRLAPSAVNLQPWRVVISGGCVHFYEKHSRGYVSDATGDMQRIDIGIAMCHFALSCREQGIGVSFGISDPGIPVGENTEYIASYILE